jgi:hypothetical protein
MKIGLAGRDTVSGEDARRLFMLLGEGHPFRR